MWRMHGRRGLGAVALAAASLLLLGACSSGDPDDAEAVVQTTTSTTDAPAEDPAETPGAGTGTTAEDPEAISIFELEVGDCFDDPAFAGEGTSTTDETTLVQCFDPHDAEVYAQVRYTQGPDADFPGEEALEDYAAEQCFDRFEPFVGIAYADSRLDIGTIWPTEDSWSQGDREALCVVFDIEHNKLEGTMDGAEL
jgi:hypothetical protein